MAIERIIKDEPFIVPGYPVADGGGACVVTCAGNWPGARVTTKKMTESVLSQRIIPERLGCGPLQENARYGLKELKRRSNSKEKAL